jgi:tRNA(Ile2)-agmatinylcytidine synthase
MAVDVSATLLAFDDTDSPEGMCTTYLAALMLEEFSDLDLLGPPRLVRLNPNIPWKTRGNAAVCLPLGHGSGVGKVCGSLRDGDARYYSKGRPADSADVVARASRVLERNARLECDKTNPGLVVSGRKPPPSLYWMAVRDIVKIRDVERLLRAEGASFKKFKEGRGIIGAAAAMAWRPRDRTWEVIAYRSPVRVGTTREIDPESVIEMDKGTRWTFNNYDYENGHVAISPGSPCPILYGIRGDSPSELLKAKSMLRSEPVDRWLLFMTNQATEDHIVTSRIAGLRPMMSVRVRAKVASSPRTIKGGHVIVRISDGAVIDAAFYEPSRGLRDVARSLLPDDEIVVYGSVRESPRSLNVEKLLVRRLVEDVRKAHNPVCERCGKSMGSMGASQGFRCKVCGSKKPPEAAVTERVPRSIEPGWYEPPVASRRHLHKPIRRMSRVDIDRLKYGQANHRA